MRMFNNDKEKTQRYRDLLETLMRSIQGQGVCYALSPTFCVSFLLARLSMPLSLLLPPSLSPTRAHVHAHPHPHAQSSTHTRTYIHTHSHSNALTRTPIHAHYPSPIPTHTHSYYNVSYTSTLEILLDDYTYFDPATSEAKCVVLPPPP